MFAIDGEALRDDLETLARFGAHPGGGVTRLAYSPEWLEGRRWLQEQMLSLGMHVRIDAAGNLIGTYPGLRSDLPPLATGSHTDTVVQGGMFDGTLGVLAGLACVRALSRERHRLRHSLEVIDFACEEATYAGGTLGSLAMAGQWDNRLLAEPAGEGSTLADRMREAGIDPLRVGEAARPPGSLAAFLELHVEQGGWLEAEGLDIGVAEAIAGIRRFRVTFQGQANHAGTTPMSLRRDALVAASQFVLAVQEETLRFGGRTVGTVGQLAVHPGSPNVVPGRVDLTVDIRGQLDADLDALEQRLRQRAANADWVKVLHKAPVPLAPLAITAVEAACDRLHLPHCRMVSGAGHDAMCVASLAPTAMVFVPSHKGISHSPEEWTDWDDCARGAQVLLEALILLDEWTS